MILNSFVVLPSRRGVIPLTTLQEYMEKHPGNELDRTLGNLAARGLIEFGWEAHEKAVRLTAKGALRVAFLPPSAWLL
jgi:hypothetical protein